MESGSPEILRSSCPVHHHHPGLSADGEPPVITRPGRLRDAGVESRFGKETLALIRLPQEYFAVTAARCQHRTSPLEGQDVNRCRLVVGLQL